MTKLFAVETPEQLRALIPFLKDGSIVNVATVWSATRRKNGGRSAWDGKIMISFYTNGMKKNAVVVRIDKQDEPIELATLKYAPALHHCENTMKPIERGCGL